MSPTCLAACVLVLFASLILCVGCGNSGGGSSSSGDFSKMTAAELLDGIEKQHPAAYYVLAGKLFEEGKKDDAVFWFYAGQLRYRYHLAVSKNLDPSGDPALFASLSETIGRPLNEYAFGDIPKLAKTLDAVLKWDADHDNGFTAKTADAAKYKEIRTGLGEMKDYLLANEAQIKAQRKAAGLK